MTNREIAERIIQDACYSAPENRDVAIRKVEAWIRRVRYEERERIIQVSTYGVIPWIQDLRWAEMVRRYESDKA